MGRLITITGNTGVGKTTLTQMLCQRLSLAAGLEQHAERPFQDGFKADLRRWGMANQVDYLLLRAEQEKAIRRDRGIGIQDGGLDQDFFVFTRLFHQKGYLVDEEYWLCERLYGFLRTFLPPPDLIVYLHAPLEVIARRYARRGRALEIAAIEDLEAVQALLDEWLGHSLPSPLLTIDAGPDDPAFSNTLPHLLETIRELG